MEILENFGLNPSLFGAQIINFLIVLYLLKRFMYKPVLDMLRKRENSIKKGLEQAEEGKALLEKALMREKEILKKAHEQSKATIEESKNQAILVAKQIEENSRIQSERILQEARSQISQETKEAEKRLTAKISDLSIDFLRVSLSQIFSEKQQNEILEKALKQIKRN